MQKPIINTFTASVSFVRFPYQDNAGNYNLKTMFNQSSKVRYLLIKLTLSWFSRKNNKLIPMMPVN